MRHFVLLKLRQCFIGDVLRNWDGMRQYKQNDSGIAPTNLFCASIRY